MIGTFFLTGKRPQFIHETITRYCAFLSFRNPASFCYSQYGHLAVLLHTFFLI